MAVVAGIQARLRVLPEQLEGYMYDVTSTSNQKNL
jgi:hypothetical protein